MASGTTTKANPVTQSQVQISNYFTPLQNDDNRGDLKRDRPSSAESTSATPACKRTLTLNNSFESPILGDMSQSKMSGDSQTSTSLESLKEMILGMQKTLSNIATKDDIDRISGECGKVYEKLDALTKRVDDSIDKFEGRLFEVEKKMDSLIEENKTLRASNAELYEKLDKQQKDLNDLQQYSRRRNLRVFNLKEKDNETA